MIPRKVGRTIFTLIAASLGVTAIFMGVSAMMPAAEKLPPAEMEAATVAGNLATFDTFDYVVFTQQQWARLHESHSENVTVHWPDGTQTQGLERHRSDLKAMFVYAPDTRIKVHSVKFGSGPWTAVIGVMEGTFTKPMPAPENKTILPTGKSFKLSMCTIGHWKDGVMDEEYLFWDNLAFMQQLGLSQ